MIRVLQSIEDKQLAVIDEFSDFLNWEDRYRRIIDLGKSLPPLADEFKIEKYKVKGCQSQVWLVARLENGSVIYDIDSDAMIVRGLAAILKQVFSGHTPNDIAKSSTDFLQKIGLTTHLSQSRSNGLAAMVRQFKNYAVAFAVMERGS